MAKYKQLCVRCKRKYVPVTWKDRYPTCYDCQKSELSKDVKDKKLNRMFKIPEEFYIKNSFLRSVKINCLRYGELSDRQIETFKQTVKEMKKEAKEESKLAESENEISK